MTEQNTMTQLVTALIKFQQEVPKIPFNAEVKYGTTNFKYADLPSIIEIVRPLLNKHGFSISQLVDSDIDGQGNPYGIVQTLLAHTSGQFLSSKTYYSTEGKPQDQGSRITYARRYAILGLLGLVGEDDTDAVEQANLKPAANKKPDFNQESWEKFEAALKSATSLEQIEKYAKQFKERYNITTARELQIKSLVMSNKKRLEG